MINSQKGFAPVLILVLLLLIAGVALAVYLVQKQTFFSPSASVSSPVSPEVSLSLHDPSTKCAVGEMTGSCWPVNHSVGEVFSIQVLVRSDFDAANQFVAKLKFPVSTFEVVSVNTAAPEVSVPEIMYPVKTWLEDFYDNSTGEISLVGGVPDPGVKTEPSFKYILATIQFKAKAATSVPAVLEVTEASAIYRNSDNVNLLTDPLKRRSLKVNISEQVSSRPVPSGIPCDLNSDGVVDKTDANLFTSKYGTAVDSNKSFDLDSNGKVDLLDFNIWISRCPTPSSSPAAAGISVNPTAMDVVIYRVDPVSGAYFGAGTKITASTNAYADTWVIESNKSSDGFGLWTTSSGITPGSTQENKLFINTTKPVGTYSGSAKIKYYKNGQLVETGPDLNYTINLKNIASPSATPIVGCVGFELGDANKDKTINLTDSSNLLSKFNKSLSDCADMNGDGKINTFDFSLMKNLFVNKGIIRIRAAK